jgi:membrane protease YdiL (CAAX protease family)
MNEAPAPSPVAAEHRAAAATPSPPVRIWGFWATLGFCLLAAAVNLATGSALLVWTGAGAAGADPTAALLPLEVFTAIPELAVLVLAVRWARAPVAAYLGLVLPRGRDLAAGLMLAGVLLALADGLTRLAGRDVVSQFEIDSYRAARAAGDLLMLWLAVSVIAPVVEEVTFRGFLYRGWAGPLGPAGAVVATALLWALLHVQYDAFDIVQIFVFGLALGYIRWRSGSTLLTILLHMLNNVIATIETAISLDSLP